MGAVGRFVPTLSSSMLSYAISAATNYFHLPIDDEEDADIAAYERKYLTWVADSSRSFSRPLPDEPPYKKKEKPTDSSRDRSKLVQEILRINNLYEILGVSKTGTLDQLTLRRAYLARSRVCHPDKFPDDPDATYAFQKVAVAYDVLSKPSSRRIYDSRSSSCASYDAFAAHPGADPDDTFRGVILGIFNDFLDGDLEFIRTLLKAINDINPSMKLGDEYIDSVLSTLEAIRQRALTCRTCVNTLHGEVIRLLEVQHAFRSLSYFDITGRSRLTIKLTRITLSLPIVLERALARERAREREGNQFERPDQQSIIIPRRVTLLIRGLDVLLDKMERILTRS